MLLFPSASTARADEDVLERPWIYTSEVVGVTEDQTDEPPHLNFVLWKPSISSWSYGIGRGNLHGPYSS